MTYQISNKEKEKRIMKALYNLKKSEKRLKKAREKRIKVQEGKMWYQKFI